MMRYISIPGVNGLLSRVVLGGPFGERTDEESFPIMDRFVELGGTVIETAHSYADGRGEEQIWRWLKSRGCRGEVVIITKVCHPRDDKSASLTNFDSEIILSASRLGGSPIDIVLLHRDPSAVTASEIVGRFEEKRAEGLILSYGISNVRGDRLKEVCAVAKQPSIQGISLLSNYYGLAKQAVSPWPGALDLDSEGEQWLVDSNLPLLCWSSLAQGWFAERPLVEPFTRVYDTALNRERRRRTVKLASRLHATPLQIAFAYTLAARFQVLASVGPRSVGELVEVMDAADISLTPYECDYLQHGGHDDDI